MAKISAVDKGSWEFVNQNDDDDVEDEDDDWVRMCEDDYDGGLHFSLLKLLWFKRNRNSTLTDVVRYWKHLQVNSMLLQETCKPS